MRKTILLLLLIPSALLAVAVPGTYAPLQYRVALKLDFDSRSLSGREEILVRTLLPIAEVVLDANEIEVSAVTSDAILSGWSQGNGKLVVSLRNEVPAGGTFKLRLIYGGKPARGVTWGEQSVRALYSTDHWMVCDFRPGSIARLDLQLELPAGKKDRNAAPVRVAASGRLIGTKRRNGFEYSHWWQDAPVTPFAFGFAVGRMKESSGRVGRTRLRFLSEKHSPEQMAKIFRSTQAAVRFMEQKSGVQLGAAIYTQVLTTGAPMQELAQMTVLPVDYGDDLEKQPSNLNLLVHELAHQWWAVRVPCEDWADFWLNEGMANFMADAFVEQQYGQEALARAVERHRQIYLKTRQAGKDRALYFPEWKKPEDASGPIAYHKGALVLHKLRQEIGEQPFWNGLRDYTQSHVGRLATTQDFQRSMEQACGRSLREFFDEWVYR